MDRDSAVEKVFYVLATIAIILTLIMTAMLLNNIATKTRLHQRMNSTLTKEEILSYNIAEVENRQINKLSESIESFSKNEKIKDYRPESETKLSGFFFTGKSFMPFFSSRKKESSKITFFYLTEKEKDTLEKDDIIQTFRGEWAVNTSKYEKDIYKEITLKDGKNYNIKFDLVESDIFVVKNYIFKKVTLETYNTDAHEILIKDENIDSFSKNYDFAKIKKEIEERYNENKDFINKVNERLKER